VVSLHGAEVEAGAVRVELNVFEPGVRQATRCMCMACAWHGMHMHMYA